MYREFYGLKELPFELAPNPKFLFLPKRHREALSNLQYGLSSAKAITVLIGEAGTGKTTLLHAAFASDVCRGVNCVYLNNPALTRQEFIEILSRRFDLSPQAAKSKAALLEELDQVLKCWRGSGVITALVIDEAQSMSAELLEEIRLLANIETSTSKLLPLVLTGHPELAERLNQPELRQLKQRVTLRCELVPFNRDETAAYIAMRVRTAGGDARQLFTREAVMMIHEKSRGIPRTISVICDNALLTGFALERKPVDSKIVAEVIADFDLEKVAMPPEIPSAASAADSTVDATTEPGSPVVSAAPVERSIPAPEISEQGADGATEDHAPELFASAHSAQHRFSLFRRR